MFTGGYVHIGVALGWIVCAGLVALVVALPAHRGSGRRGRGLSRVRRLADIAHRRGSCWSPFDHEHWLLAESPGFEHLPLVDRGAG
jgi:hypothetical protein